MKQCFYVLFVFWSSFVLAQESQPPPAHATRERTYDVLHYKLNLTFDVRGKSCQGDAAIMLVPLRPGLDTIDLDAAGLNVTRITLEDSKLEYILSGETLAIALGKPYGIHDTLTLSIRYSVTSPKKGLYFIQPDSGYPNKQWQVWSQGEQTDNHYWFPCYDAPNDKATSEVIATVDDGFTAVSNGKLVSVKHDTNNHTATFHWIESKPHVSYLISVAIGEYVTVSDSWNDCPIDNYVYARQKSDAMRSFGKTPAMLEYFSSKIGYRYPWEKYGHALVHDFMYSGQENVSISTITDRTIHDARAHLDNSSDALVAHELAHQWFGDLVSFRDWSHSWLSEGFASYFEMLFQEYDKGRDAGWKEISDAQTAVVNSDRFDKRRPTVTNRYVNPSDLFDNRIYQKGACVLHMLRFILGDELFWKSINHYVEKFAFKNVETNDFKIAIEEATGYNLDWFFDEWLYKAGYPEFDITSRWDDQSRTVQLTVRQAQRTDSLTGVFRTPVDIEVWVHGEPVIYHVEITKQNETFSFPAYQEPQLVLFDQGNWILKKVNFQKPIEQWIFQLEHAQEGVDRLKAIDELTWVADSLPVRKALEHAMLEDHFSDVRREATWALGDAKKIVEPDSLLLAYGDRESKVRVAAVTALRQFHDDRVLKTLRYAFSKDSSYAVAAAALRSLTLLDSMQRKQYLAEALKRDSYNEVIRSTALDMLAGIGDDSALELVKSYSTYGIERNVRLQAIRLLGKVWGTHEDVFLYILRYLNDPSFQVKRALLDVLGGSGNPVALGPLNKFLERESDSRLLKGAREAIEKIQQAQHDKSGH
ncbi:MAG: HEAT repeat domain-containing protein [Ignavibacteriae bacterium]|nr:HEAT repeat domain-containing protein [Ignavibacteria bacterium]MBI3364452.1 HEAT repeat domain-containing protein [Ignavibacteriota bacterium]